jgi:deoxyribose-phosphate aldolase
MLTGTFRMTNLKINNMKIKPCPMTWEEVKTEANNFLTLAPSLKTPEILSTAFSCIDLTTLNTTDTVGHVAVFTAKVNSFELEFKGLPNVAAICVFPHMAGIVRENLAAGEVKVAAVAGGFPHSMTFLQVKKEEARLAVVQGADEIDIVLPLWAFLEGNLLYCREEITGIKKAIGDAHLKVILETGLLADPEKIWQASLIALEGGADFIKTSTGKASVSATPEAAVVMCSALRYWYELTGEKRGFKPAGGIVQTEEALVYLAIVRETLGDEWLNNQHFRIGASRLANHLLSDMLGRPVDHF